ncbi:MAG: fimbrillin family protein [Bacteroidales bacterium]|nr:fimbrillin family protein [Bacteroidales bacterium]
MKKIFLCALAAAALTTACNKAEVIDVVGTPAIQFENAFVNNATRAEDPSTTTASIEKFSVWGYMDNRTGEIFTEEIVSKTGSDWTYANTQYWLPKHTYYFAALSATYNENDALKDVTVTPNRDANAGHYGLGVVDFVNADGTNDLLYASAMQDVAEGADLAQLPKVGFSFSHLLSKVKFTFTNGFENANSTLKITGLTMTAPKSGTIDLNVENWWDNDDWKLGQDKVTLAFGDVNNGKEIASTAAVESDNERLTIPAAATQEYVVTFHVQLYNGDVLAIENDIETKISGVTLDMGKAYNFKAVINASNIMGPDQDLYPIEFEVIEVKEWVDVENVPTKLDGVKVEGSFTLVGNATAVNTVNVAGTFDGAGNTIAVENPSADFVSGNMFKFIELNGADVTLKNVTVDGQDAVSGEFGVRNIVITGAGEYLIDNVKSINATYPLHVSTTADVQLTVVNSTMEGWLSYNAGTTATFENVAFTTKTYGRFRPYGTTVLTNCSFVDGYVIDLSRLAAGEKVTFVNCTYNGAALTATNVTTVDGEKTMAGTYEIK